MSDENRQLGDGGPADATRTRRWLAALASWAPPLVAGFVYFAAYYPAFTNHDSQSTWLNAFQYFRDPANAPIMNWYAPLLTWLRVGALESGLGVAGYHALFCLLTFGTWAALVATLLAKPWHRLAAHALLLLPFIGTNLAFQASDVWVAVGLAWMVIALRRGFASAPGQGTWTLPLLYLGGSLLVLGARQNAFLALPVFIAVPLLFRCHPAPSVRRATAAAPLAAFLLVQAVVASLPTREEFKTETYMAFEAMGVWKAVLADRPNAGAKGRAGPSFLEGLPQPPGYYLARWDETNVDAIIWDLREFEDKGVFIADRAPEIRREFYRMVREHPLRYAVMKLRFARNALGLTPPDALPVSTPPPSAWIDRLGIPLYHRPLLPEFSRALLSFNERTRGTWGKLTSPLGWWLACLAVFTFRAVRRETSAFDGAWLALAAGYYATIAFFAPIFLPRYVFPVWVILGVGTVQLLLAPTGAGPSPRGERPPGGPRDGHEARATRAKGKR